MNDKADAVPVIDIHADFRVYAVVQYFDHEEQYEEKTFHLSQEAADAEVVRVHEEEPGLLCDILIYDVDLVDEVPVFKKLALAA